MSIASRGNIGSAINTFGRVVGMAPADIPADAASVQSLAADADPAAKGIGTVRWRNVRTELRRALRLLYGDPGKIPLTEKWKAAAESGRSATEKTMLRRLGYFCCAQNVEPGALSEEHFAAFINDLASVQHSKTPQRIADDTRRFWNRIAAARPELMLASLAVVSRSRAYTMNWSDFPPSLEADVLAYCSPSLRQRLMSREKDRPKFSPATSFAYNRYMRRLASAAVLAGVPAASLMDLKALVSPAVLEHGLGWLGDRNGGEANPQLFYIASVCLNVARHWAKLDEDDIEIIRNWVSRFREVQHRTMTEKNMERLGQFSGGEMLSALINLPEQIFADLENQPVTPNRARLARDAVMVALLTVAPMRLKNLRHLCRKAHLRSAFSLGKPEWQFVLKAGEVKNTKDLAYPIPPHVMTMIERYLEVYQPLLTKKPTDLPPSEWPNFCFRIGHEGGMEWRGSTSRKRSSASCVKRRSCW
ncbi:MAG: hypothetical protein AB7G25_04175, partial [Sphingomonadaceae bacterium]